MPASFSNILERTYALCCSVWPRQGTDICNFGAPSPLDPCFEFQFSPRVFCVIESANRLKMWRKLPDSGRRKIIKSCHVSGCFLSPNVSRRTVTHWRCQRHMTSLRKCESASCNWALQHSRSCSVGLSIKVKDAVADAHRQSWISEFSLENVGKGHKDPQI